MKRHYKWSATNQTVKNANICQTSLRACEAIQKYPSNWIASQARKDEIANFSSILATLRFRGNDGAVHFSTCSWLLSAMDSHGNDEAVHLSTRLFVHGFFMQWIPARGNGGLNNSTTFPTNPFSLHINQQHYKYFFNVFNKIFYKYILFSTFVVYLCSSVLL